MKKTPSGNFFGKQLSWSAKTENAPTVRAAVHSGAHTPPLPPPARLTSAGDTHKKVPSHSAHSGKKLGMTRVPINKRNDQETVMRSKKGCHPAVGKLMHVSHAHQRGKISGAVWREDVKL